MTDLATQLRALADELRNPVPVELDIWSAKEAARFLKISPRYFSEQLSMRPDFPRPIRIPSKSGAGSKRWRAREVINWVEKL